MNLKGYRNSLSKREMGLFLTVKELSQKKFCSSNLKKIEVLVQSKEEAKDLNLLEEMKKNSLLHEDFINFEKYFKNFYGYIVLFECMASDTIDEEKEKILGIGFFSLLDTEIEYLEYIDSNYIHYFIEENSNMVIGRMATEEEYNTVMFILERFLKDIDNADNIIIDEGPEFLVKFFEKRVIKEHSGEMFIDETKPIKYYNFQDLNDLIQFLKDVKIK